MVQTTGTTSGVGDRGDAGAPDQLPAEILIGDLSLVAPPTSSESRVQQPALGRGRRAGRPVTVARRFVRSMAKSRRGGSAVSWRSPRPTRATNGSTPEPNVVMLSVELVTVRPAADSGAEFGLSTGR